MLLRASRPLTGGRGLKQALPCSRWPASRSPPHGGARIETYFDAFIERAFGSPPHGGARIETALVVQKLGIYSRPLTGGRGLKRIKMV